MILTLDSDTLCQRFKVSKFQCVKYFTGAHSAKGVMNGKVASIGRQEHTTIDIKVVVDLSWSAPIDEEIKAGHAACIMFY